MIVLPWLLVGLGPLIVWVTLFGLRQSWATILNAIRWYLRQTAHSVLRYFNLVGLIADAFSDKAQPNVHQGEKSLGAEALQAEPTTAGFVAGLAGLAGYYAFTVKYVARDTLAALEGLVGHTIPARVKAGTATAREASEAAAAKARAAAGTAAAAIAAINARVRTGDLTAARAKVLAQKARAKAQAIAIPAEGALARERVQAKRAAEDSAITRWLRRIAVGVGAGVFAGLIVRVLVRHLPWYQCDNVKNLAKRTCGMNRDLLNSLLADTLIIAGSLSLIEFARECSTVIDPLESGMKHLIREFHGLENQDAANRAAFLALIGG